MAFVTYASVEVADSAPLQPGCALTPRLAEPEHSRRLQTPPAVVWSSIGSACTRRRSSRGVLDCWTALSLALIAPDR